MDKKDVLIPGGGGAAGTGAIKSLRLVKHRGKIISTDSNALSAGLYLADRGYKVPPATSGLFVEAALDIIKKERLDVVLPTSGFDIIPYSKHKTVFEQEGVTVAMSDYEVIDTCLDKKRFYGRLKGRFDLPFTATHKSESVMYPCIVKPVFGKGSKDVFFCGNESDLDEKMKVHQNMLIQEYLPGREFTIDVLSDLDKRAIVAVPRERIEVKAGISFKGKIVLDTGIQNECVEVAEYLGIRGPSCMQMKCDCNGVPKIVEVNPRMGGGTIMATYAGINFPDLVLKLANDEQFQVPDIKDITMLRFYEEVILDACGAVISDESTRFWRTPG